MSTKVPPIHSLIFAAAVSVLMHAGVSATAQTVSFVSPTNGQTVVTMTDLSGSAQPGSGSLQQAVFSIYNQSLGQWWNGAAYQGGGPVWLPTTLGGTNWAPAGGVNLPAVCCGQIYQLAARVTDTATNTAVTNITVFADAVPPVVTFSPLATGQTVADLNALGGGVADNLCLVYSVSFSIHELDINSGSGRWWTGTNFQSSTVSLPATVATNHWSPAVPLPALNSGQAYEITVTATDTTSNSANSTIVVTNAMAVLTWDPGQSPGGTAVLSNPNTNGGNYWFRIMPQNPAVGVWRTALNVPSGQAGVYLSQGALPNIYSYSYRSANPGSNGFVLHASQFSAGQNWHVLINASPNSQWTLVSGDAFVHNLGSLATDGSSSTNASIGAEGMAFFQTTIPAPTLAWQLWLNGAANTIYVKKSVAPHPASYDLIQAGQMLVVPPYLSGGTFNGTYFVAVSGSPGTALNLDSRQHPVQTLDFSSSTNLVVSTTNFPYVTYRVQVPVQQIAWQLNLAPVSGNPAIAVRRDLVPNEFHNDAYSEVPVGIGASVALVPPPPNAGSGAPGLSDGTFFITVYSGSPFTCSFTNANPVITDVDYLFSITNDAPGRAGWRYYRVATNQLGTLGWALTLSNQVPGTEIALRRNAVPGQWTRRDTDNSTSFSTQGYVDLSSYSGLLQQPGHQADVWYIGVYTPTQALGNFVLSGLELTGQLVAFDGSATAVSGQPPGQWGFFRVIVPADSNLLGWDLRLVNVTNGNPQMVIGRDTLPTGLNNSGIWTGPYNGCGGCGGGFATNWPSGNQWLNSDWQGLDSSGGCSGQFAPLLAMGMGNPLQPGTYYIGVQDPANWSSFTLLSRGIAVSGYSIVVKDLAVTASATNLALPVGEADYYRVVVPPNLPDWRLHLSAGTGEALLKVQRDYLPNSASPGQSWAWANGVNGYVDGGNGGQLMMKSGDDYWTLLGENGSTNVIPGTYYVVVASQGQNPTNGICGYATGWGTGTVAYQLSSSSEPVTVLPGALSYGTDLLFTNVQANGDLKLYQLAVPPGIASIEVRLEDRVGNPIMYFGTNAPIGTASQFWGWPYYGFSADPYGNFGGLSWLARDPSLITMPNPQPGLFGLSVYASGADASYVVRVHAAPPPLVAFDGGTAVVTDQAALTWQFFRVDVPSEPNLLGWDIRLVNVTNGNPQMVVSRDTLPVSLNSSGSWTGPNSGCSGCGGGFATNWPSGNQWLNSDWQGFDASGCGGGYAAMLAMGLGNPLQPGTYYIGVQDPNHSCSYTVQSRGIGLAGYSVAVRDLPLTTSVTNLALAAGEADYYRVIVPTNQPGWKLRLSPTVGDVLLKVQRDYLPNSAVANQYWAWASGVNGPADSGNGGQMMMKNGDEQWLLLGENGTNTVYPGTYYVVVASQGQNLTNSLCGPTGWGTGNAGYRLSSWSEPITIMPGPLSYGSDLLVTNTQAGGEMTLYQFAVPPGIATVEVTLESRVGNPMMYLGTNGPTGTASQYSGWPFYSYSADPYGNFGGASWGWRDTNLITVANPPPGAYSLSVYASSIGSGNYPDASYVVRVHAAPPPLVAFDGGTAFVTNQAALTWQFFRVVVPSNPNLLGWDIRMVNVTNGNPQMVVSRDTLPISLNNSGMWTGPNSGCSGCGGGFATNWPSGNQWLNSDWQGFDASGCGGGYAAMLAMGLGNPLQPGTYYIGVQDPNHSCSYTVQSRGIGLAGYSLTVRDLPLSASVTNLALAAGEADYYRVVIPTNQPDWKLRLGPTAGEVLLKVQRDYLPNSGFPNQSWPWANGVNGPMDSGNGGQLMMKSGDEQWLLLGENGTNTVYPGTYYVVVASQGQNLTNSLCGPTGWGTGNASYRLSSGTEPLTVLAGTLSSVSDLVFTNSQAGGEMKLFQFTVPPGIPSLEVRFENRIGNPVMYLGTNGLTSTASPYIGWPYYGFSADPYGNFGGNPWLWRDLNLITIPNPKPGTYALSVYASKDSFGNYIDANYVLRVRAPAVTGLSCCSPLSTGGLTNVGSGVLADNQRTFFQVTVPATVNGASVLGWKLNLTALNGSPSVRVRQNLLPDDVGQNGTSQFVAPTATIVPPYLSPGTWYVEVKGSGSTTFSLTSSVICTNALAHPLWAMPALGQTNSAPGLALPMIGDSGITTNGTPLPGDQGIDLALGDFDFYAVVVPTNNAGLLRTELQAISGDPNLYVRVGSAPTLTHDNNGNGGTIYDRSLTGGTSEYGNWVPLKGRYETQLTAGVWVLAVQAGGSANARYRLRLSCGNPLANGLVQDLPPNGGSVSGQNLNGYDWRYYRIQVPDPAPANWTITWSRSLGSARMFVRDTVPPGDGMRTRDYSDPGYNPTPTWPYYDGSQDLETWSSDGKNEGPYPRFDTPGTVTLSTPPLRPGAVYYLGFWSPSDTTFAVSSSTNAGPVVVSNTIAFYGGSIARMIPAHGSLMYRMDVPLEATRILLNASNSANLTLSLEQGTIALPGGPAHWTSSQPNASLNQLLLTPNNWPWLPGRSYYLTVTNTSDNAEDLALSLPVPADLRPVAAFVQASVISTTPNPMVQVVWGITNQGPAPATGNWYDAVWFSTNGVLDSNAYTIAYAWLYNQNLPPGGSYWQTNTVALPMTASGAYTLFVQADAGSALYEASLSNKFSGPTSGTFTLAPPDLAPVQVIVPTSVVLTNSNPSIQLAWRVANLGSGAASGGWYNRVWFSTNGLLDSHSVALSDLYYGQTLDAGSSYWFTNTVTLPVTNTGNFTLFVQSDVYGWMYESNKGNNVSAAVSLAVVPPQESPLLVAVGFVTNDFRLAVYGQTGQANTLQVSSNLVSWASLTSFVCTNVPTYVTDPGAKKNPRRFYRLVQGALPMPITLTFGSASPVSANGVYLVLSAAAGSTYSIEASTNLVNAANWQTITNFMLLNSPSYFYVPANPSSPRQFFRAKLGAP